MKFMTWIVLAIGFCAQLALAEEVVGYKGNFNLNPTNAHKPPMTGEMQLLFENAEFKHVKMVMDQPVFGTKEFISNEQILVQATVNNALQLTVIFKLSKPSHKWYYVWIGTYLTGGRFDGRFFRVPWSLDQIRQETKDGVTQIPDMWLLKGTGTLAPTLQE